MVGRPQQYNNMRGPGGAGGQYNRPGQQRIQGGAPGGQPRGPHQQRPMPQQVAQPVPVAPTNAAPQVVIASASGATYLANPDPKVNAYNQKGFNLLPAVFPENPNLKQMVGEFIYPFVEEFVGEAGAPKITGMLIDLPIEEIKGYLYDFSRLYYKIGEAVTLLTQLQSQGVPQQSQ